MDHNNPLKNNDNHNVVPVYKQDMKQCAILQTKNKDPNGNYYPKLNGLIIKSDEELDQVKNNDERIITYIKK